MVDHNNNHLNRNNRNPFSTNHNNNNNKNKRQRTATIDEEDVCTILQRYTGTQVLALLKEVAATATPGAKIDWELVANNILNSNSSNANSNNNTAFSSARDCQLLWRHLAYRHPLFDHPTDGDTSLPLDDDSDLEFELEASPPFSTEIATEAANCVKVLTSGSQIELSVSNCTNIERDMPNAHLPKVSSENLHQAPLPNGSNINLSTSIPSQPQPQREGNPGEGLDSKGLAKNYPPRRKRKMWTVEEELELVAAVEKYGESNWTHIVNVCPLWDRTPQQLSQRWTNIKKKQSNAGGVSTTGPRLSDLHLTNQALDIALKDNIAGGRSTGGNGAKTNGGASATNTTGKPGTAGVPKSRPPPKKAPAKPTFTDPVTAMAVAAGARILDPSEAQMLQASQTKNTSHVRVGSSLGKPSATVNCSLPPNVHYICTGLLHTSTAAATLPRTPGGSQTKSNTVKVSVPSTSVSQLSKAKTTPVLSRKSTALSSTSNALQPSKVTSSTELKVPVSDSKILVQVKQDAIASRSSLKAPPEIGQLKASSDVDPGNLAAASNAGDNSECEMRNGASEKRSEDEDRGIALENPTLKAGNKDQTTIQETGAPRVKGTHEHGRRLVTGDEIKRENSNKKLAGSNNNPGTIES